MSADTLALWLKESDRIEREVAAETSRILRECIESLDQILRDRSA